MGRCAPTKSKPEMGTRHSICFDALMKLAPKTGNFRHPGQGPPQRAASREPEGSAGGQRQYVFTWIPALALTRLGRNDTIL
jgi:hypothetical protein